MPSVTDPAFGTAINQWLTIHGFTCLRCHGINLNYGFACELAIKVVGGVFDVIPVVCTDCGHTELLAAKVVLGIAP